MSRRDAKYQDDAHGNDRLKDAYESWDAGEPSADVWEHIDESLSLDAVWNRVDRSLFAEEREPDLWMRTAHEEWSPAPDHDGWPKLNDSLSLEQVWNGLNTSLNQPVATRIPYWKLIAASVVALFITRHFGDMPVPPDFWPEEKAVVRGDKRPFQDSSEERTAVPGDGNDGERLRENTGRNGNAHSGDPSAEFSSVNTASAAGVSSEGTMADEHKTDDVALEDPLRLNARGIDIPARFIAPRLFEGGEPVPFHHWSLQFGTQLSIMDERNQSSFTSTSPRFGVAADLSYRHRIGKLQLIHALGLCQYQQEAGKYINGRYWTTDQRISALQWSTALGYSYDRFTFYGGFVVSKMLSGLEQKNNNAVMNVYSFNPVQTGFTAGIDYRIASFPNSGKHISVGSHYQWLPSYGGGKTSFENIQGIRLQLKFSF